jgi:outer membrane protein assembly complex protein YaeT
MRRCLQLAFPFLVGPLLAGAVVFGQEEGAIRVRSFRIEGVQAVNEARLRAALATRESSRLPWGEDAYFDRARFDADLKRLEAYYADRGYPDARVTSSDVALSEDGTDVDLTVTISEGNPILVGGVNFVGFDVIPPVRLEMLEQQAPLRVGEPRDRQQVIATRDVALNALRDFGYPYARLETGEDISEDGARSALTFTAVPGTLAYIGPIQIQGNTTVTAPLIERYLGFKTGDLYQRQVLQESQRRLYALELFQFANVEPLNTEGQPAEVPIRITVAETRHQRVNFGVGYGTEEKARVEAEYHHVNFFGGARLAGAFARWSSLDRGIRLDLNQPYLFSPDFSLNVDGQEWRTFTPAYESRVTGAKATVRHQRSQRFWWAASLLSERSSSSIASDVLNDATLRDDLIALGLDPTTGKQSGTLNAIGFDLQLSTADDLVDSDNGYQLAFHVERAGRPVAGTFEYDSMSIDGRHYFPVGAPIVVASRLQLGNIRPAESLAENVPFSKKFFLGGATSIRGWGRYEVSPLSDGLPIGGNSMMAFSEELRITLPGRLGAVLFLDGGNVWADSWQISLDELRYAAGWGLRYRTPVGAVRLDVGYQLNPISELKVNGEPQRRPWRIHFSIGQAF